MVEEVKKEDAGLWYGYDVNAEKTGTSANTATRTPNSALDKDAFLKLLLTQMQYQDPLNPTDDKQFIAQMAQLTATEQMQNMSKSFSHSQAYGMIGKSVYAKITDEQSGVQSEVTGEVTSVIVRKGEAILMVGEKEVPLNKVEVVFSDNLAGGIHNLTSNVVTGQNLSLMGKYVQAIVMDENQKPKSFIEGKVDYIKFDSKGNPVLVIGNEEVYAKEVLSVSEEMRLVGKQLSGVISHKDGTKEEISGPVTGVQFQNENTYITINGQEIFTKSVALVTDALKYVGQSVQHEAMDGVVSSVVLRDGIPYLVIGGPENETRQEINFASFKGVKLDADE